MSKRKLVAAILILFVTGCESDPKYVQVDLTPQLIPITADQIPTDKELENVSDETYDKIEFLIDHILTLEGIILSTHQ